MSAYDPPTEDIGVFNSSLFTSTSENITQSYADTHYLKFPTSQSATETISSLVVSNDATINGLTVGKGNSSVSTNTVVGSNSLSAITSGNQNTALGYYALSSVSTGSYNVGLGYQAGYVGTAITTGSNNTFVGFNTQSSSASNNQSTALGSGATITGSNQIVLGTSSENIIQKGGYEKRVINLSNVNYTMTNGGPLP